MAMKQMPIDQYGYYAFVEPFAGGYYEVGEKEKAREILKKLMKKYQGNLTYFKTFSATEQNDYYVDIVTDIERYRGLLEVMKDRGDKEFYEANKKDFNSYNTMFKRFERDNE